MSDLDYLDDRNYWREVRHYLIGFGLALALTLIPFAIIYWKMLAFKPALTVIGLCALLQMVVHLRFFLHIDLSRQKREDLQLILFSVLLLAIMALGTIWIIGNLGMRM